VRRNVAIAAHKKLKYEGRPEPIKSMGER